MTDSLDDLLDRSAPALADRGSTRDTALAQMAADARDTVHPPNRPRRRHTAIAAALAATFLIGGGGVAVAAGLVDWPAGFEHPDSSFAFTLPSGRACEVRLIVEDPNAEAADGENRAQAEIERWLASIDLWDELDMHTAERDAARIVHEQQAAGMVIRIGSDGWLTDAPVDGGEATPDDLYAFAVDRAVRDAMSDHLSTSGIRESEWSFSTDGGVKCAAE